MENITFTLNASGTAVFDADDVIVTASGGDISAANAEVWYASGHAVSADKGPLMFDIDFGAVENAGDGTEFQIQWDAAGIVLIK